MASDLEFSDSSNATPSPLASSPGSSPTQQVPHLANFLSELSCMDDQLCDAQKSLLKPYLRIIEQPYGHFRFRYLSEMSGSHGCIVGSSSDKTKTHPTVELVNYTGEVYITCRLAQDNNDEDHPHQLLVEDENEEVVADVGPDRGYEAVFAGMGIIHPVKKSIPTILYEKRRLDPSKRHMSDKELRADCFHTAKRINLNIVRLKFTAYDSSTKEEICEPVLSTPIFNMNLAQRNPTLFGTGKIRSMAKIPPKGNVRVMDESALTNNLEIRRMSLCSGRPKGGDDIFLLVEKVASDNIEVRFVEVGEHGEVVWTGYGSFSKNDVHRQCAIVVKSPPYKDPNISTDVTVKIELRRPSDGTSSPGMAFTYNAKPVYKLNKKRKANSYSSIGSLDGSLKSNSDIPMPVLLANEKSTLIREFSNISMPQFNNYNPPQLPNSNSLGDALMDPFRPLRGEGVPHVGAALRGPLHTTPLLSYGSAPKAPSLNISEEINKLGDNQIGSEEMRTFCDNIDIEDYLSVTGYNISMADHLELVSDSAQKRANSVPVSTQVQEKGNAVPDHVQAKLDMIPEIDIKSEPEEKPTIEPPQSVSIEVEGAPGEYNAYFSHEDGLEAKRIVKEICASIKSPTKDEDDLKSKLERLLALRLSNGDTFLHMTLCNNVLSSMEYIVKVAHAHDMLHLLNIQNDKMQTILHLAILHDLPIHVGFLVSKGCDPMIQDIRGDNAIHYAVTNQSSLLPLLEAAKNNDVLLDLNAHNKERKTALHIAAFYDRVGSIQQLIAHGARCAVRDAAGRSPLHLASYGDSLRAAAALLEHCTEVDVNMCDDLGFSVLQVVCGSQIRAHTLDILQLLLEHGANPMSRADNNKPAWVIARDKPEMMKILQPYLKYKEMEPDYLYSDSDSETDQEPESLEGMSSYINELAPILDCSGGWRALAVAARSQYLCELLEHTGSPTRALLGQFLRFPVKMSSTSLALMLRNIGEAAAADIVVKYITRLGIH